jgi:hypothetical protein
VPPVTIVPITPQDRETVTSNLQALEEIWGSVRPFWNVTRLSYYRRRGLGQLERILQFLSSSAEQLTPHERDLFAIALGHGFGELLARSLSLQWCSVSGGIAPLGLRTDADSHKVFHPVEMVVKRIDAGELGFLPSLYNYVRQRCAAS